MINAGIPTAYLTEVVRQKVEKLRRGVELAAGGDPRPSLKLIEKVHSVRNAEDRYARIASDYVALPPSDRDHTLVVTGTNESRRQINENIGCELGLEGTGRQFTLLNRHDSTQAERRQELKTMLGNRINDGVAGKVSTKSISEILDDELGDRA